MEFLYVDFLYIFKKHFVNEQEELENANDQTYKNNGDKGNDSKAYLDTKALYLSYRDKKFRKNITVFLKALEPRRYEIGDIIQEQNLEVYEVVFIMRGKVGVAYRLFNDVFFGLALTPRYVINDYAMLRQKVSEFIYKPILCDNVEGLAIRKENWMRIFLMPFFKKNYSKAWC